MSLSTASVVVCAGGGLLGASPRAVVRAIVVVARGLGAEVGATRAVVDAGWFGPERLVGASGVTIDPELYVGFGVSGAVFHEIGGPARVISVNTDAAAPLTLRATLPLLTDAPALLAELARRVPGLPAGPHRAPRGGHRPAGGAVPGVGMAVHERVRLLTAEPTGPVRPPVPSSAAEAADAFLAYADAFLAYLEGWRR